MRHQPCAPRSADGMKPAFSNLSGLTVDEQALHSVLAAVDAVRVKPAHLAQSFQHLFPDYRFRFVKVEDRGGMDPRGRVLDQQFNEVAPNAREWLWGTLEAAGPDLRRAAKVLSARKDLLRTAYALKTAYFTATTGDRPEDFVQLEIEIVQECLCPTLVPNFSYGDTIDSMLRELESGDRDQPIGPPRYLAVRIEHMAQFLVRSDAHAAKEHRAFLAQWNERVVVRTDERGQVISRLPFAEAFPDAAKLAVTRERRWMFDWEESSAGESGARVEDHWIIDFAEGSSATHVASWCSFIPQWVTAKRLPSAQSAKLTRKSNDLIADWLDAFDRKVGHPFAWYFFMLHGNRIDDAVGHTVAEAARYNAGWMPENDRAVLARWANAPYGF